MNFQQIMYPIRPEHRGKRVKKIKVRLLVSNCRGTAYFTDVFLQSGTTNTGWVGHVSENRWASNG